MVALAVASAIAVYFDATATGAGGRAEAERFCYTESWKPSSWAIWVLLF